MRNIGEKMNWKLCQRCKDTGRKDGPDSWLWTKLTKNWPIDRLCHDSRTKDHYNLYSQLCPDCIEDKDGFLKDEWQEILDYKKQQQDIVNVNAPMNNRHGKDN